jgi:hypothetical protein
MTAYADPVAQAEVVRLRARVAELEARERRVEALHRRYSYLSLGKGWTALAYDGIADDIRAALDGTQP